MYPLTQKELNSNDKILKPDFNQKTGRELLAFYLQTKFKQILALDKKYPAPIFIKVNQNFIANFSKRLINNPHKRLLIGITGESASGKSTICHEIKRIIQELSLPVSVLSTDNYFNDISELIKRYGSFDAVRDHGYDIDAPESMQLNVLKEDLETLSVGQDIMCPVYLPNGTGVSLPNAKRIAAEKVIVVEGIATVYDEIRDLFDVIIYVETDLEQRQDRFFKRAYEERNQDCENAQKHWNYIVTAGDKYIKPHRNQADLILNGNSNLEYFSQILEYIHIITNNFS